MVAVAIVENFLADAAGSMVAFLNLFKVSRVMDFVSFITTHVTISLQPGVEQRCGKTSKIPKGLESTVKYP